MKKKIVSKCLIIKESAEEIIFAAGQLPLVFPIDDFLSSVKIPILFFYSHPQKFTTQRWVSGCLPTHSGSPLWLNAVFNLWPLIRYSLTSMIALYITITQA